MAAYMKADPIKGQITDAGHKEYVDGVPGHTWSPPLGS